MMELDAIFVTRVGSRFDQIAAIATLSAIAINIKSPA